MPKNRGVVVSAVVAAAAAVGFALGAGIPGSDSIWSAEGSPRPSASSSVSGDASPTSDPSSESSSPTRPAFEVTRLAPGGRPPQFVVVSFDGAGGHDLFQHYLSLAERTSSRFTFFLTGLYLLPAEQRAIYKPPGRSAGDSALKLTPASSVAVRVGDLRRAWESGHEIGTHFNGHFCGADGVSTWSSADWRSEMNQANTFLTDWPEYLGTPNAEPLPFGPDDIVGGRTPCLEGNRDAMRPVFAEFGFRYDASDSGTLAWPVKTPQGFWEFPLQAIKRLPTGRLTLSMDYNFFVNQSGGKNVDGPQARQIEEDTYQSYLAAYSAVFAGNRAPLFIGNHFNTWNDAAYKNALTRFVETVCVRPETQCISNEDLADWLDAQDPAVVASLQGLGAQVQ